MKYKKSQLTMFILIGLILLISFSSLFYIAYSITKKNTKKNTDASLLDKNRKIPIEQHIQACLDQSLEEGLVLLGNQGGVIYKDQGGLFDMSSIETINYNGSDIVYRITVPYENIYNYWESDYPCANESIFGQTPYTGIDCLITYNHEKSTRIFNESTGLSPFGRVSPNIDLCNPSIRRFIANTLYSCGRNWNDNKSVENQLESFIVQNVSGCMNLTILEDMTGSSIINETLNVSVFFGKDDVTANLIYPLTIASFKNTTIQMKSFDSKKLAIPFKRIYESVFGSNSSNAKGIADRESAEIMFDIIEDSKRYPVINDWVYEKEKAGNDNIISITVPMAKINGIPYSFRFAVKNRKPALDYLGINAGIYGDNYYDICVTNSTRVEINATAVDPDEEPVFYQISPDDLASQLYAQELSENMMSCINQASMQNEFRCTYIETNEQNEEGIYSFTLKAIDAAGNFDMQTIKMLVSDYYCG